MAQPDCPFRLSSTSFFGPIKSKDLNPPYREPSPEEFNTIVDYLRTNSGSIIQAIQGLPALGYRLTEPLEVDLETNQQSYETRHVLCIDSPATLFEVTFETPYSLKKQIKHRKFSESRR